MVHGNRRERVEGPRLADRVRQVRVLLRLVQGERAARADEDQEAVLLPRLRHGEMSEVLARREELRQRMARAHGGGS